MERRKYREEPLPIGRGTGSGRGMGYRFASAENQDLECSATNLMENLSLTPSKRGPFGRVGSVAGPESACSSQREFKLGMSGKSFGVSLKTNFVRISCSDSPVYEYNVSFSPALEYTRLQRKVMKELEVVIGSIHNFDGHVLYLPFKLEQKTCINQCQHPSIPHATVSVIIKFVKEKPVQEMCQFYDLLFQRVLTSLGYERFRQGFYEMKMAKELPQQKLQVWPGVSLTVENNDGGLMVMFDTPRRIIRTDTVYDYYYSLLNRKSKDVVRKEFTDAVIGKIVSCTYNGKCYKIDDVDWDENPASQFEYKGHNVTFRYYFMIQYGVTIKNLDQPLLLSRIRPRKCANSSLEDVEVRIAALVPELCTFTGLTYEQRGNRKVMTEIDALTKLSPVLRVNLMEDLIQRITKDYTAQKILLDWGLRMESTAMKVNGGVLKPPRLVFHKASPEGKIVEPNFSKDSSKSCFDPVEVKNFVIICTKHDKEKAMEFVSYYKEACMCLGIRVRCNPQIGIANDCKPCSFVEQLRKSCTEEVQFVVIVTPSHQDDLYRAVKSHCSSHSPIPSQCIMARTIQSNRFMSKVALNVALQINCKLGGAPWALRIPSKRVMFLGMDAAHDPGRKNPSVIALIATMNDNSTRFFSTSHIQPVHQEVASSLRTMFLEALFAYAKENAGQLPERIIFYRDGGCAGTFEILKKFEVDVCLEVLQNLREKYPERFSEEIQFSYVCVAKRIPERILLFDRTVMNPHPGTVVEEGITKPHLYDFYIVSQLVSHGTVTPTHYTVLYETNPTPPDLLQKLTYAMTYMYFNFQGTIKVPAVIQYAHKLGQFCSRTKTIPSRELQKELFFL